MLLSRCVLYLLLAVRRASVLAAGRYKGSQKDEQ